MSTELAVSLENGKSLAELIGVSNSTEAATPSIARLNVNQKAIEADVEFNGKMLKDEVVPQGAYKLTQGENVVYAANVSIRVFAIRQQWQRWNGDTEEMEKSVLSTGLNGDLKDSIGGFNLGRPSGYIEDFNALPDTTKALIRSVKRVKVYFGLVTLTNPVDADGNALDADTYVDVPFVFDVKNRDSLKALDACMNKISKKNLLPIMHTIDLSPAVGSIPTGATFGYVAAALGQKVELSEEDNDTIKNFLEFIEYVNGTILDKHEERSSDSLTAEDAALVANIIEVEE